MKTIEPPGRMLPLPCFAAMNAPQYRTLKKPRAAAISVSRDLAKLQRFAGGVDEMIELADFSKERRDRLLVREVDHLTGNAGLERGKGCIHPFLPA